MRQREGALDVMFSVHEEHSMCSEVAHVHTTTKKKKEIGCEFSACQMVSALKCMLILYCKYAVTPSLSE